MALTKYINKKKHKHFGTLYTFVRKKKKKKRNEIIQFILSINQPKDPKICPIISSRSFDLFVLCTKYSGALVDEINSFQERARRRKHL